VVWDLLLSGESSASGFLSLFSSSSSSAQVHTREWSAADARSPFANGATFVAFEMAMRAMA
jgi:hypothetical protein